MKKNIRALIVLSLLTINICAAQQSFKEIELSHSWINIGRTLQLSYEQVNNNHSFLAGLNFFQNSPLTIIDNQNHAYRKRFKAYEFKEHFGLTLGYGYLLTSKKSCIEFYPNFKFQIFNMPFRNKFDGQEIIRPKTWSADYSIGLRCKAKLTDAIYLVGNANVGLNIYYGQHIGSGLFSSTSEFGGNFSAGLSRRF